PAEKHVEPRGGLPERGSRRRGAGSRIQTRIEAGVRSRRGGGKAGCRASGGTGRQDGGRLAGQAAEQRPDRRDPQRLPLRLSKGLRGCSDRRRSGTAMSREEQIQGLGELPEGG